MAEVITIRRFGTLRLRQIGRTKGVGPVSAWLNKAPGALARFRIRVRDLNNVPRTDWHIKQFRYLKGGKGLAEIKWKWSDREWRAFGYFDSEDYFALVMGCTHKESYDPPNCLETAHRRMQEALRGEWEISDYEP
jgi:hypothetical protein